MVVDKKVITFPSTTGLADIHAVYWAPRKKASVKAIIQIAHGMAEHIDRYDTFARFLANNGFAVFADDHIGHGESVKTEYDLGYFGDNNSEGEAFIEDCKKLQDIAKEKYPDMPYFFFGHSMGSFIARKFSAKYGETLNGVVYCGTAPKNPASKVGLTLANFVAKVEGERHKSKLIDKISFMGYNKNTEKLSVFDWLSRDREVVNKYIADSKCGFLFSARGYADLISLLDYVSSDEWYKAVPNKLPIFMISGGMDPVGAYGKGVKAVAEQLRTTGHTDVTDKIYLYDRHEILNELDKDEVYQDVVDWLNSKMQ